MPTASFGAWGSVCGGANAGGGTGMHVELEEPGAKGLFVRPGLLVLLELKEGKRAL